MVDKNDNKWLPMKQKITIKNNSKNPIKYKVFLQDHITGWHYYYPCEFSFTNYKCYLPIIELKPSMSNVIAVNTSQLTKIMFAEILPAKKNDVIILEIPDSPLYIYNDDTAFRNYSFNINKNKEFVFIITNLTALIASILHIFKRPKKKLLSIITLILCMISIIISTLFLINFTYIILI